MSNYMVVGASSGIGKSVAEMLVQGDNKVVCVARREGQLRAFAAQYKDKMTYICYDLQDLSNIETIFIKTLEEVGKLSGLVYCAGISNDMPIRVNDLSIMQQVLNVNCNAFVEAAKFFSMKKYSENGSSIVAISSTASLVCDKGMCTYAMSKSAMNAAIKVMSKEFLKRKIRVNGILPNFVNTEMMKNSETYIGEINEQIQPLGIIEPLYIGYLVEFLLSEKSKYMTGALIPVTAGA